MIEILIDTLHQPRLSRQQLRREFWKTKILIRRLIKSNSRLARRKAISTFRNQYYISSAMKDLNVAVRHNEDIFVASLLCLFIVSYGSLTTAANIILSFLKTAVEISGFTRINMGLLLLVVCLIFGIYALWVISFLLNTLSFTIMDGAVRKKNRTALSTVRRGLKYASRTTEAWFMFGAVLTFMPALLSVAGIICLSAHLLSIPTLSKSLPYATIAAITWVIVSLLNYSLVPYVALYEPQLSLFQVFERSRRLVVRRGRMFILAGYGLLAGCLAMSYLLGLFLEHVLGFNRWAIFSLLTMGIIVIANGLMTILYRKRKLARLV